MGVLVAAGRKRRGFKEDGLAYGEITAQGTTVDVAPSTGSADPDIRGIKKNTEPSGAPRRTTVHHDPELVWGESARIVRGEYCLGKLSTSTMHAKQFFRRDRG